jgi:hypothetical protein
MLHFFSPTNILISRFIRSRNNLCLNLHIAVRLLLMFFRNNMLCEWAPCHHDIEQLQAGRRINSHTTNLKGTREYSKQAVAENRKSITLQLRDKARSMRAVGTGYAKHLDP